MRRAGQPILGEEVTDLISKQSKKEDLWREVERLREASDQERNRAAVLESEARRLEEENRRLSARTKFIEGLSDRVRSANEKLEILHSLTQELASFDLDGVLEVCVQRIPYMVGARYASVYAFHPEANQLVLKQHTHGHDIDRVVDLAAVPNSLMAVAVRTGKVLCINDLGGFEAADGTAPARPYQEKYSTSSCVVAPLVAAGQVEGVLNLADRFDQSPFDSSEHLRMVEQACELVAVALHNARLFDEVQRAARTDSLTGLRNHQDFSAALSTEAKRALRYKNRLAVLAFKVHGLGLINANHGHQVGDHVIRSAAKLVEGNIRDVDLVGRAGGGLFGIILPEQELSGAEVVARRLTDIFSETPIALGGVECRVKTTCGVAEFREGTGAELFQAALSRLDHARRQGRPVGLTDPE